jgi:hypothetical protein
LGMKISCTIIQLKRYLLYLMDTSDSFFSLSVGGVPGSVVRHVLAVAISR